MSIIFHADDFGLNPKQAGRILSLSKVCGNSGRLTSVSIFPNSPSFKECTQLAKPFIEEGKLLATVHLNIVEGPSCAPKSEVPLLVDDRGMFKLSFIDLLKRSYLPNNEELLVQIALEFICQIERFLEQFPTLKTSLRLDSHQHFHTIPLVYRALELALQAISCKPDHIRVPLECNVYLRDQPKLRKKIQPINVIKTELLAALWAQCSKRPIPTNQPTNFFSGILFSGHMEDLSDQALSSLHQHALRYGKDVEVLYHPFGLSEGEKAFDELKTDFITFHRSPHRLNEANALRRPGIPV